MNPIIVYYAPQSRLLIMEDLVTGRAQVLGMAFTRIEPLVRVWVWAPGHYLIELKSGGKSYLIWAEWGASVVYTAATYQHLCGIDQHPRYPDLFVLVQGGGADRTLVQIVRISRTVPEVVEEATTNNQPGPPRWLSEQEPPSLASVVMTSNGSRWFTLEGEEAEYPPYFVPRAISGPDLRSDPEIGLDQVISYVRVGELLSHVRRDSDGWYLAIGERRYPFLSAQNFHPAVLLDAGLAYRSWIRRAKAALGPVLPTTLIQYVLQSSLPGAY